ncbi:unnamed protein product, partial [Amoebophrya sp. A120]|eukprot:GSA120T00012278001.1
MVEVLAVLKSGWHKTFHEELRATQMFAVITQLDAYKSGTKGRLGQVPTGEGKTAVVGVLAAALSLHGKKVDIITSSSELAKPQAGKLSPFFRRFGVRSTGTNTRFAGSDVVYGSPSLFQWADLRHRFSREQDEARDRDTRPYDIAIIDESDSLMVDGKASQALLSTPLLGAHHLHNFVASVWLIMKAQKQHLKQFEVDGELLTFEVPPQLHTIKTWETYKDELKAQNVFVNESQAIENRRDPETGERLYKDWTDFLTQKLEEVLRKSVRDFEPAYPFPAAERIEKQTSAAWTNGAQHEWKRATSWRLSMAAHMLIYIQTTTLYDHANTYSIFLICPGHKIKHGLRLLPENFSTNFLSNVKFIKGYDHVFGLTGTLGDQATLKLMHEVYGLDFFFVPGFKQKQFYTLRGVVLHGKDAGKTWLETVVRRGRAEAFLGRAVLVVCESIKKADAIHQAFEKAAKDAADHEYTAQEERDAAIERIVQAGDVIIATNISGRGTDIKLSDEVEKNGGMHVSVTFIPKSKRVQEQNFGRTARTGLRGTAQLIARA